MSSKVVYTDLNATEDKQLLDSFTTTSKLYWYFNVFTHICRSLDCLIHLWITIHSFFYGHNGFIFYSSLCLNILAVTIETYTFGSPFYWITNNFKSKYSSKSSLRLIQLKHRYKDIVNTFFAKKKRSTNSTKNFAFLNIKILSTVYCEDFGPSTPTPLFATHEMIESIPQCLFLFIYSTYYNQTNLLYTSSILLSLICISCQTFNFFAAATNSIHYSILGGRYLCSIIDVFGSFCMMSCLYSMIITHHLNNFLINLFYYKFILITLPLSFCLSWLFVLRAVAMPYNPHHPPHVILFLFQLILIGILILLTTMISSFGLEICSNFYWMGVLIHRLFNERFSYWDGNNNFWRRIIEWMMIDFNEIVKKKHHKDIDVQNELINNCSTDDKVLRLFSVNSNLCNNIYRFNDKYLKKWMDDNYAKIYYSNQYKIDAKDFNAHSQIKMDWKIIGKTLIEEQIGIYFMHRNRSTAVDVIQYMNDASMIFMQFVSYIIDPNNVHSACDVIFHSILNYTLLIATPIYLCSRIFNVTFPLMAILTMSNVLNLTSFTVISTILYYCIILVFLITWFVDVNIFGVNIACGHNVACLIYALCPSMIKSGELYVSLKYGYFTQHELFERILWHYDRHRYAKIEGRLVIDKFGKDIARAVFDFLPKSYAEEKCFAEIILPKSFL